MSVWSVIGDKLKEILQKMIGARTIERELHITPAISTLMEEQIELWTDMYKGQAYWLHEPSEDDPVRVASLGLPALIAGEKARMVLIEFESEITTPTKEQEMENPNYQEPQPDIFGNLIPSAQPPTIIQDVPISDTARADFLNAQYKKLKKELRRQLEYAIAQGGLIIKPYVVFNRNTEPGNDAETYGDSNIVPTASIEFSFIHADCFYPLAFDSTGNITEAAFVETKSERDILYRRLEYHKWTGTKVEIINKAFKSTTGVKDGAFNNLELGKEISLKDVPEWKDFQEKTVITNVTRPLFAYFRMPEANTVDTTSPLGVSGYSRAVKLIMDADMQYSRLLWEYEAGEMAIDIDRDALRYDNDEVSGTGHTARPHLQERLMRKVDLGSSGDTYNPFSPALRDNSYIQGLNSIFMRIEDSIGMSHGTLSDATQEAKTATEIKILKQRSYQTNKDIQDALEDTLRDVAYIMDVYCSLYNLVGDVTISQDGIPIDTNKGQWDISFEWDDSLLTDVDEELNKRLTLQQNGLLSRLELRMWYFGETERQAKEALLRIQDEDRQTMEDNLMMESNMAVQEEKRKQKEDNLK